jgi:hypothetical protein
LLAKQLCGLGLSVGPSEFPDVFMVPLCLANSPLVWRYGITW